METLSFKNKLLQNRFSVINKVKLLGILNKAILVTRTTQEQHGNDCPVSFLSK